MSTHIRRHYWAPFLLLSAILPAAFAEESLAEGSASPLFYASFEKRVLADQAEGDAAPLGNKGVSIARRGRQGRALFLDWGALLSFAAAGNVYPEQGTLSFWWQPDESPGKTPFSIIRISTRQLHSPQHLFAHLFWTGQTLKLRLYDRDSRILEADAGTRDGVVAGRWIFLAFTWHELEGLRFFMDGREVDNSLGRYHFGRWLDQIGIHTQALTPYYRQSNERRAYVDEFRIFCGSLESRGDCQPGPARGRPRRPAPLGEKGRRRIAFRPLGRTFRLERSGSHPASDRPGLHSSGENPVCPGSQAGLAGSRGRFL